jgi:hypothetical protein
VVKPGIYGPSSSFADHPSPSVPAGTVKGSGDVVIHLHYPHNIRGLEEEEIQSLQLIVYVTLKMQAQNLREQTV